MENPLPQIIPRPRSGAEQFRSGENRLGFTVGEFWSWSASDLVSNTLRGVLAEYLVAQAVGALRGAPVRTEWDAVDVTSPEGLRIEVKSSAFVQSWAQAKPSRPSFSIRESRAWDAKTGETEREATRSADVYVFALLWPKDQAVLDPLDVDHWQFWVVPTGELNERFPGQRTIGLASLYELGEPVGFGELGVVLRDLSE